MTSPFSENFFKGKKFHGTYYYRKQLQGSKEHTIKKALDKNSIKIYKKNIKNHQLILGNQNFKDHTKK